MKHTKHSNNNNNNNNLLLIERYLRAQINSALRSKILITTSLILITDINIMVNLNKQVFQFQSVDPLRHPRESKFKYKIEVLNFCYLDDQC